MEGLSLSLWLNKGTGNTPRPEFCRSVYPPFSLPSCGKAEPRLLRLSIQTAFHSSSKDARTPAGKKQQKRSETEVARRSLPCCPSKYAPLTAFFTAYTLLRKERSPSWFATCVSITPPKANLRPLSCSAACSCLRTVQRVSPAVWLKPLLVNSKDSGASTFIETVRI